MKRKLVNRALAGALSLAMILTAANVPVSADAAAKASVKLKKTKVTVQAGAKTTLKVVKKNVKKVKKTTWKSTDKKVAKVSKKGVVTGVAAGKTKVTCKITFKTKAGKTQTKTLKCTVKVTAASAQPTNVPSTAPSAAPSTAPSAAPSAVPTEAASSAPSTVPTAQTSENPAASPEPSATSEAYVKWDDTSNIGEAKTITIEGGHDASITKKDNGTMRKELSSQYLITHEMGVGINLGNTMEATKAIGEKDNYDDPCDYETAWSAPITTQEYIDSIHSYGFNTLRIPVAWSSMVKEDDTTYTINPKFLSRVEEIVNYALNNGMYVIVNEHYDYGWWGRFGSKDADIVASAYARYEAYWKQITERFKGYSDHLIFESANEEFGNYINDNNRGFNTAVNGVLGEKTAEECYAIAADLNQRFVNIVRNSGGNNKYRHLLIAGFNTNIGQTANSAFIMPTDIEENGTTKLSVSVHDYDPWSFCGDSAQGTYDSESQTKIRNANYKRLARFTEAGYGIIIGECGVCNPLQDGVVTCLEDFVKSALEYQCLPVFWDTPGNYFNREEAIMNYRNVAEMMNRITGAHGNTNIDAVAQTPTDVLVPLAGQPSEDKMVWKWEGLWAKNDGSNIALDGSTVTAGDMSKFIQTTECTDADAAQFNDWGYQLYLKLDWASIKKPAIYVTFQDDSNDAVGTLNLSTTKKKNKSGTDAQSFAHDKWIGKTCVLPGNMITRLQTTEFNFLEVTFGNKPIVTGIYIYDMEK